MGELVEIAWVCPIFRQREGTMNRWKNRWNRLLTAAVLGLLLAGLAAADTLELKDGRVLRGKYLGGTQAVLRFEVNGEVQTFSTVDIVALTFTGRSVGGPPAPAPSGIAPTAPPPMAAAPAAHYGDSVTIPAGQSLLVRMIDGVDSSKNPLGDGVHARLGTDL